MSALPTSPQAPEPHPAKDGQSLSLQNATAAAGQPSSSSQPPKANPPGESITDAIITAEQELLVQDHSLDARFTSEQLSDMNAMVPEYTFSLRKQKSHITRTLSDKFIKQILDSGAELDKAKRARVLENVQYWFSQRCRVRENVPTFFHPYSARQVFYKENPLTIKKAQRKMYCKATNRPLPEVEESDDEREDLDAVDQEGASPEGEIKMNGKAVKPFDFFQLAITKEYNKLSDEEKAEYERKALEWRVQGPTEDVKQERAEKDLGRLLFSIAEHMFKQMGVKMYFFVSYKNTKNQVIRAQHDFGKRLYGSNQNFREIARPAIIRSGVWNRWLQFTRDEGSNAASSEVISGDAGDLLHLPFNEFGEIIIPDPNEKTFPKTDPPFKYLQKVVRCVVSHANALAMGRPIEKYKPSEENCCHWGAIERDPFRFIKRECFPAGEIHICDPSGLKKARTAGFVQHWWDRQQKDLPALEFHSYMDSAGNVQPAFPRRKTGEEAGKPPRRSGRNINKGPGDIQESDESSDEGNDVKRKKQASLKRKPVPRKKGAASGKNKSSASMDSSSAQSSSSDEVDSSEDSAAEHNEKTPRPKDSRKRPRVDSDIDSSSEDEETPPKPSKLKPRARKTPQKSKRIKEDTPEYRSPSLPRTPDRRHNSALPLPQTPDQSHHVNSTLVSLAGSNDLSGLFTPHGDTQPPRGHLPDFVPHEPSLTPMLPPQPFAVSAPRPHPTLAPHLPNSVGSISAPLPPQIPAIPTSAPTLPPQIPAVPTAAPTVDLNGLLLSHIASLLQPQPSHVLQPVIQGGHGQQQALAQLLALQLVQTPSRNLADSLQRFHIDTSPSKPSTSSESRTLALAGDMEIDVDEGEDGERESATPRGLKRTRAKEKPEGEREENIDVRRGERALRDSEEGKSKGNDDKAGGSREKPRAGSSRKGKGRMRDFEPDDGEEPLPDTQRSGERSSRKVKARAEDPGSDDDGRSQFDKGGSGSKKGADKVRDGKTTRTSKATKTRDARSTRQSTKKEPAPSSPSKADQRMLDYTQTLVGGSIGGKRAHKKKVRDS